MILSHLPDYIPASFDDGFVAHMGTLQHCFYVWYMTSSSPYSATMGFSYYSAQHNMILPFLWQYVDWILYSTQTPYTLLS